MATATTTIRVNTATHARLVALSEATGMSLQDTVGEAAEALSRQRFGRDVASAIGRLRADDRAWDDYLAEAGAKDVGDGLGR